MAASRIKREAARPFVNAGVVLRPGDKVMLRPDQIDRLEKDGYLKPARQSGRRKKQDASAQSDTSTPTSTEENES